MNITETLLGTATIKLDAMDSNDRRMPSRTEGGEVQDITDSLHAYYSNDAIRFIVDDIELAVIVNPFPHDKYNCDKYLIFSLGTIKNQTDTNIIRIHDPRVEYVDPKNLPPDTETPITIKPFIVCSVITYPKGCNEHDYDKMKLYGCRWEEEKFILMCRDKYGT